jgi:hypothetical protein
VVIAASQVPKTIVLVGYAVLLFGVVLALSSLIPFYAKQYWDAAMKHRGLYASGLGAVAVFVGNAAELSPASSAWETVQLGVLVLAALLVVAVLVLPRLFSNG